MKAQKTSLLYIPDNKHVSILGSTQSGKTYGATNGLKKMKKGVLFFNTKLDNQSINKTFHPTNSKTDINFLVRALERGSKINYMPGTSEKLRDLELKTIIDYLIDCELDYVLAVDEVQLYRGEGLRALRKAATVGLGKGTKLVNISQRGANMHNDLLTQSEHFILFGLHPKDIEYLEKDKIPAAKIQAMNKEGGKYSFCSWDLGSWTIQGPYRIG